MEITFRKATADDAAEVVSYLRAFAAFNKIEDEFTATEESVRTWMFERGYGWVEWRSLDWNTRTSGLYYVLGAEQLNGWTLFHLANGQLKELAHRE